MQQPPDLPGPHAPGSAPAASRLAGLLIRVAVSLSSGLALVVLVLKTSLPAYLAQTNPSLAVAVAPGNASAHLQVAETAISHLKTAQKEIPQDERARLLAAAQANATAALEQRPLSAQAVRILGEVSALTGEHERAARLIAGATMLNQHEYAALLLEAQRSWEGNDILRAVNASDAVLRTRPDLAGPIFAALAGLAETPAGRVIIKQRLLERPPWRDGFLNSMLSGVRDASMPLDLMLHLKAAGHALPQTSVNTYLQWLLSHRLYGFAHTSWMQLLDRERLLKVGFVFNGDFEFPPTGAPFDWTLQRGTGATVEIAPLPEAPGNMALRVELSNSRVQFGDVHQRLSLAPGDYVMTGRYRGEFSGRRGLQWRVSCTQPGNAQLGQTPMLAGQFKAWREFSVPVTIPPQGCPSQLLRLLHDARHSAEQFANGLIWFDEIRISRSSRAAGAPLPDAQSTVERSAVPP